MSGLIYGYNYKSNKGIRSNRKAGVFYGEKSKKWIVRIIKKNGQVSTIGQFDNIEQANECYLNSLT